MKTSLSEVIKKKVGRPLGSKNKPKKIILSRSEVEFANKVGVSTKDYAKQKIKINKETKKLEATKDARLNDLAQQHQQQALLEHMGRIKNLEHQAVGYRAVISYLSHQLGLKE
jgi:hypothetical protein